LEKFNLLANNCAYLAIWFVILRLFVKKLSLLRNFYYLQKQFAGVNQVGGEKRE